MKHTDILLIIITTCIYSFVISCSNDNSQQKLLKKAEAVIDEQPDSALTILNGMRAESNGFSRSNRMKFNVLLAYSMTKCDIPIDTMTSIKEAVDYYDTWGNSHERMIANYMMGSVFRDRGDAPMALQYFREAINAADTTKAECDFKTLSRIYGQTAGLFHNQRSPEYELEMERKAEHYANLAKDTISAIIFYSHLSDAYYLLGNEDSVMHISQETRKRYMNLGMRDYAATECSIIMDIYLKHGDYHNAKKAMNEYEQYSGFFDENGDIEQGREIYYESKGKYYLGIEKMDSAEYFYRKMLRLSSKINNIENGYKGLMLLYQKQNIPDSIAKYATLFAQINDSACVLSSSEEINRIQNIYNYNENKRIAEQKSEEADKYKKIIYIIILLSIILSYIIYKYIKRQQIRERLEMQNINTQYSDALSRFNELQKINAYIEQDFEKYKTENNKEIEKLKQLLASYQEDERLPETWDLEQAVLSLPFIKHLHKLAQRGEAPTDKEWTRLHDFTNKQFPDFSDKIRNKHIGLTNKEIRVCILTKLRFIPTEIAVMLDTTKQNITNIRGSINRKLFNANGTKSFDFNIRNM